MGLLGLRKFIDSSGCCRTLVVACQDDEERRGQVGHTHGVELVSSSDSSSLPCADHVLVDLNCIVHSCFNQGKGLGKTEIIQLILARLRYLHTRVVLPRKSLTFCLDGPAPYAKLRTQRIRRRKLALMDAAAGQLTSLAITAGSLFLVELENALAAQFKLNRGKGFLPCFCPVFLFGSTVVGEGEAKISQALALLACGPAAAPLEGACVNATTRDPVTRVPPYDPNDTVVVLGNDIDLVLTCLAATPYHNLSVVSPSSLQIINVGDLLYRWMRASSASGGGDAARITPTQLPSVRVDFVFLFLLNGGDHYVGAGEVAVQLWQRYRTVRAAYPGSTLVSATLDGVDVTFLADVLQTSEYTGDADVQLGLDLLESALWSLYTVVTGVCPDYTYIPHPAAAPYLSNVRAAVARCQRRHQRTICLKHYMEHSQPLTPLETYVALMPTEATLPRSVAAALQGLPAHRRALATRLLTSADAAEVARCAQQAVAVAATNLTRSEELLQTFTSPVQLNIVPPRRRLSRYEQHRMLAKTGRILVDDPLPVVRRVAPPALSALPYVNWTSHALLGDAENRHRCAGFSFLSFHSPFDQAASPPEKQGRNAKQEDAAGDAQKRQQPPPPRCCERVIYLNERQEAETEELRQTEAKLQQALHDATSLRRHQLRGNLRNEGRLRAAQRRLHRLQSVGSKRVREAASTDDHCYQLHRGDEAETALFEELKGFLGEDADDPSVSALFRDDRALRKGCAAKARAKLVGCLPAAVGKAKKAKAE